MVCGQVFLYFAAAFSGFGRGGKIERHPSKSSLQNQNPNAGKPLYATVSCQLLRPHVRATLFCEGVRCAMKAQQRNIKHTQFDAWDSPVTLAGYTRRRF